MKFFCMAKLKTAEYCMPVYLHKQFGQVKANQDINYQNYQEMYTVVWMMPQLQYQIAYPGL